MQTVSARAVTMPPVSNSASAVFISVFVRGHFRLHHGSCFIFMPTTLSVIIITKDAENTVRWCLESVKWADEIIVLDSGSRDRTLEICSQYTSKIFSTDWPGFGIQKNRALAKATGDWILSLDADEALSDELSDEVRQMTADPCVRGDAYAIQRVSFFCGKKITQGDWGCDQVIRLFRNQVGIQFSPVVVHETVIGYQQLRRLKQVIFHQAITHIDQVLIKAAMYSTMGAQLAYQRHQKTSLLKAILHGVWCFLRGYFFRFGFLDGREGFIIAFSNAVSVFYRYVKLIYSYTVR